MLLLVVVAATALTAQAEPRKSTRECKHHNYILSRQQAYQVQGVPTERLIIGRRQIDIYPNGLMFERDHVAGVTAR